MDDAVKHLTRLLRSGAITPQTYAEGLSALQDEIQGPPTPTPRRRRPMPTRRERPTPAPRGHPTAEMDAYIREILSQCPTRGPSRPHAGEGLSRPRASWCSAGLAGSSAHSCEDGRWMCLKGTPMVQTPGLS